MPRPDRPPLSIPADASPELVLAQLDTLPTLPAAAVRLLEVTGRDDSSAVDVADTLRADQSLTARLLSLANSAAGGLRDPISSIDRAIVQLGMRAVRRVVLTMRVFDCFARGDSAENGAFDRTGFWKHALAVACAAERLAEGQPQLGVRPEEAFAAGLLHDVGKVALASVFPRAYDRVAARTAQERGDIADNERLILGTDHTLAGRKIAERWRLPRALREVIWLHHLAVDGLSGSVSATVLVALVQLADTLAREQRIGYSGNHLFFDSAADLARRMGVESGALSAVAAGLVTAVSEQAALLQLDRETPQALYFESLSQANAELARLNEELQERNRRLAAAERYFRAQARCDAELDPQADLPAVLHALANAGIAAFQRGRVGAFALRPDGQLLVAVRGSDGFGAELRLGPDEEGLAAWLSDIGALVRPAVIRAPRGMMRLLAPLRDQLGEGELWLVLIAHDDVPLGGFAFVSASDERARLSQEADELRAFLGSAALAIGRASAQAAARRLSDDLADANRRLVHMQMEVLRTRTLSTMAELAAGAGHELNNPLAVISGRAQMLAEQVESPEIQRSLGVISEKAHECSRIVSELMDFARPRPPQPVRTSAAELLEDAQREWETEGGAPLLGVDARDATPDVLVDRGQFRVVLRELLRNALQAVADSPDPGVTILARRTAAGDALELLVRDNGCGMSAAVQQRAFDPFYSHRPAGRGRGLGLPRAHRIVEAHGGRIWSDSRPGEGTIMHIVLPPAPRDGPGPAAEQSASRPRDP